MPKFAPNTGFRMPGLGSKEKNSASNFRDEQHVDKMGYCDNTPDAMLPSGSSPLNYKPIVDDDPYTSAKYSGELAVNIPDPRKKTEEQTTGTGDTYNITNNNGGTGAKKALPSTPGENTNKEKISNITAGSTKYTPPTRTDEGDLAYSKLTQAQKDKQDKKYIKMNTKNIPGTTSIVYKVNGKVVDEATYNASGSSNKSKVKK